VVNGHCRVSATVIGQDISWLFLAARLLERHSAQVAGWRRSRWCVTMKHHHLDELDLHRESGPTPHKLDGVNFEGLSRCSMCQGLWTGVAQVCDGHGAHRGLAVNRIGPALLDQRSVSSAKRDIDIYITQVFRDSFFPADMHPGNVFFVVAQFTLGSRIVHCNCDFGTSAADTRGFRLPGAAT